MKSLFLLIILVLFGSSSFGKEVNIDSVLFDLKKETDPVKGILLHFEASDYFHQPENSVECLRHLTEAKEIASAIGNDTLIAQSLMKIGVMYYHFENGPAALDNFNQALLIENGTNPGQKVRINNMMGVIFLRFEEYDKSVDAFKKAVVYHQLEGAERIEAFYNNVALAYTELYEFDSSLFYHQKCMAIRSEKGDDFGMGQSYNNMGSMFYKMEEYDSALLYFQKGLELRESATPYVETSIYESKINVGKALVALKQYRAAELILLESQKYAQANDHPDLNLRILEQLLRLYSETRNYQNAYENSRAYYGLRDSLFGMDQREEIIRLNHENIYAQKVMHDSLIAKEKEKARIEREAKEQELREEKETTSKMIQMGLLLAVVLMLGIIVLGYRNYKSKQKAAEEILFQKQQVEHQRDVANEQRDIAERQKERLRVVNQEITDSITYAERIQKAILPSMEVVLQALPKSFVYYQPKAIVAGDFYWVHEVDGQVYFAAADCTGHGVPGAMVSVICSNALNRSVDEFGLRDPGKILDKTTELLIETFVKSNENVKDGMDISLCCLNRKSGELLYSGANNPLYIITKKSELLELKATKQPIGWVENKVAFETKKLELNKGDLLYSFTDGFADQFGGPKGKKYKYNTLKKFLLSISSDSMDDQKNKLSQEFEGWKGDLEQLDDICIIGVEV